MRWADGSTTSGATCGRTSARWSTRRWRAKPRSSRTCLSSPIARAMTSRPGSPSPTRRCGTRAARSRACSARPTKAPNGSWRSAHCATNASGWVRCSRRRRPSWRCCAGQSTGSNWPTPATASLSATARYSAAPSPRRCPTRSNKGFSNCSTMSTRPESRLPRPACSTRYRPHRAVRSMIATSISSTNRSATRPARSSASSSRARTSPIARCSNAICNRSMPTSTSS
jgi:hypothetical protein